MFKKTLIKFLIIIYKNLLKDRKFNNFDIIINLIGFIDNKSYDDYNLNNLINSRKSKCTHSKFNSQKKYKTFDKKELGKNCKFTTVGMKIWWW